MSSIKILARAVIFREDEILLAHSKVENNTFLPGGHVEFGEFTKKALKRELKEELGVETEIFDFLGTLEYKYEYKNEPRHEINLIFYVKIKGGFPYERGMRSREDKLEFLWVKINELKKFNLLPEPLLELIPEWIKKRKAFFKSTIQHKYPDYKKDWISD